MNVKDKIKNFLNELSFKYKDGFEKFKYEYNPSLEVHLIEVSPISLYNNISYGEDELNFCVDFMDIFGENILFVSSEDIIKIVNPEFEISNDRKMNEMFELLETEECDLNTSKYIFKSSFDDFNIQDFIEKCGNNNLALAA